MLNRSKTDRNDY